MVGKQMQNCSLALYVIHLNAVLFVRIYKLKSKLLMFENQIEVAEKRKSSAGQPAFVERQMELVSGR